MTERATRNGASSPSTSNSLWLFFVLVFCWTWSFWIVAAISGTSSQTPFGTTLILLGLLGPMLGGIGFAWFRQSRESWLDYWSRILDPKRVRPGWYLIIVAFVPGLMALAVLLDVVSGGSNALALIREKTTPFLSAPSTIVPFVLGIFIMGPLPEELGWRGYALDQLQARWNALASSLILGVLWALWHLPLFFIRDTYHYSQGAWSAWFWLFMVQVVSMAIILTWIFNNTRRSTLAAILFHFMANLAYALANLTVRTNLYSTLVWIVVAIAIVASWVPRVR